MSQPTHHLSDDTSDRLYTPEELSAFAAAEGRPTTSRPRPDRTRSPTRSPRSSTP